MIPNQELPKIVGGLLEKTKKEKVNWEGTPSGGFRLQLPQSVIRMQRHSTENDPEYILFTILGRPNGEAVGMWAISSDTRHWDMVAELFDIVNRRVTRWDSVLEDINRFISTGVTSNN